MSASPRISRPSQPALFHTDARRRPFVILKAAVSVDGCMAEATGRRTALTSAPANRHAHRVRAEVDAIGVGVGTILVDDPLLTPRGVYRQMPLSRVIFDRSLRTPPEARVLSTRATGPVIIVTTAESAAKTEVRANLEARGAEWSLPTGPFGTASGRWRTAESPLFSLKEGPNCTRGLGREGGRLRPTVCDPACDRIRRCAVPQGTAASACGSGAATRRADRT